MTGDRQLGDNHTESTTMVSNSTQPIISEDWAKVAFTGAVTCSSIGIIVNALTIYVIWARKSIRNQSLAPLLFFLAISDFLLSSIGVPIQAARYIKYEWPLPPVSRQQIFI